ncbi:RagB/SusD family nutrient uptake outer membrane protein [Pedobacter sp. HMF7647]|uniref:RagB/SusD family nutrient uptake outer membrane protein n=1 Tax=Hufsiella arboris TaxID=2695275 RepID=A0A7K1Y5K2_9SPHI|nr:RagB/SusD family nutrient uptake outer membrane protein [Hufsiella arboris]MXV49876.1 RagB/SusD family nutrient uptake outer membrane protein [Hufsiella arboris]
MKRKILYIIITFIGVVFLNACKDDFLDQTPSNAAPTGEALNTDNDVLTALTGAYAGLRSVNLYGRTIPVSGDLLANNTFVSQRNSGRYTGFDRYSYTVSNTDAAGMWNSAYAVILRANNIINSTPTGDQATIDQYKGEAYAIRALMYFELVRFFAKPYTDDPSSPGVPIVLTFDYSLKPARSSVEEVYTQILSDLDKAYTMTADYNGSSRLSKYSARALAAKVNLFKGTTASNALALEYADDVIANGGFLLLPAERVQAYWSDPKPQSVKLETLFEVVSDEVDNLGTDGFSYMFSQDGYGDILSNPAVYNLYSDDDARKGLIEEGARSGGEDPAYIISKFPNVSGDVDDTKVLRLSEVFLIAAEAAARTGDETQALTLLNTLVSQRDPSLVYESSGAQLVTDILLERRKEMAFEGDWFHELNRLKLPITGRVHNPTSVPYGDYRRVFPIPQSEKDANPGIQQNAGWGG